LSAWNTSALRRATGMFSGASQFDCDCAPMTSVIICHDKDSVCAP